jgi:tRNA nucleotidyltransferase (CCA-adding enzyme)
MKPGTLVEFLSELDAFRQPERFGDFLKACECDSRGRTGLENCELPETEFILTALQAASSIDAGAVAKQHTAPEMIKKAVFEARLEAVKLVL